MTDPAPLIALATELEKEGQYNAAKLLRAAATAAVIRQSTLLEAPRSPADQADLLVQWASQLDDHASSLAAPMRAAADAIVRGRSPYTTRPPIPMSAGSAD